MRQARRHLRQAELLAIVLDGARQGQDQGRGGQQAGRLDGSQRLAGFRQAHNAAGRGDADGHHAAVGLEGSPRLAAMARTNSGCEVWEQDFLQLELPPGRFDGVFANASLFHVPAQELPRVLAALHATLKPRGVLFASNPRGRDEEGWSGQRYGAFHSLEAWRGYVIAAGLTEIGHYYRPSGLPREQQLWLASVWRKGG